MRYSLAVFFFFFSFSTSAQRTQADTSFLKEWFTIDTLILEKGLNKTALTKVNELYQKASQRNLPAQKLKSLIYRYSLENNITEKGYKEIITDLSTEIDTEKVPVVKALLRLLLAKKMIRYYNDYRWQIYNRKPSITKASKDIDTWSMNDFYTEISSLYLRCIKEEVLLQSIPMQQFDAVLIKGTKTFANSSLYDLAIREALEFFKYGSSYVRNPIETFSLKDEKALSPLPAFIQTNFHTQDSSSYLWQSLSLYKKILKHHSNDTDKELLLNLDQERINWVYVHGIFTNREEKYEKALSELTTQYKNYPGTAEVWSQLAALYINRASGYTPFGDTANRYAYVKAKQIIENAIPLFDSNASGVIKMKNQLSAIHTVQLMVQTEWVNIPNQPFRAKLDYRNMDSMYIRILKIDGEDMAGDQFWNKDFWQKISKQKQVKFLSIALPRTNDHQMHGTELALPGLAPGNYALLCSNDIFFNDSLSRLRYLPFMVSNISYIKNGTDFFVVNRETGKPLQDVKVTVQKQSYNNTTKKTDFQTVARLLTDKNGHFSFPEKNNHGYYRYHFEKGNDQLKFMTAEYEYYNAVANDDILEPEEENRIKFEKNNRQVFFFTDRSIYRPGQTVYYKGIGVTREYRTQQNKLLQKDTGWAILQDVNGKKIDSLPFTLNEYGSFHGKFQLPVKVLTGHFSIITNSIKNGSAYFSVEEYKRPTYSVVFEKPKGSYRLNDSIRLTGNAKAFAGNNIDGAKVTYQVTRHIRRVYPWYWRGPSRYDNSREISNGNLITDASGNFTISFTASADDIRQEDDNHTVFAFTVNATVTDKNGETRTASTEIAVGYQSLQLSIENPQLSDSKDTKAILVKTTNLSNEPEPANVTIKVYTLQTPERLIRKRLWEKPDQFILSEKEFIASFPYDEYASETDMMTWPVLKLVEEGRINTKEQSSFMLQQPLEAGQYKIEAITTDKDGQQVKALQYLGVFNSRTGEMPNTIYQLTHNVKTTIEPGDTALYLSGSAVKECFVIKKTATKNNPSFIEYQTRKKGLSEQLFTATETNRGGAVIAEAYILHNRLYTFQTSIEIPWSNKQLNISYQTFRNKTEPGSKETWTVQVKGTKNETIAAELLTTMYDASLDQFRNHQLNAPFLWRPNNFTNYFTPGRNFTISNQYENPIAIFDYLPELTETVDRLAESNTDLYESNIRQWIAYANVSDKLKKHVEKMMEDVVGYNSTSKVARMRVEESYDKKQTVAYLGNTNTPAPPAAMAHLNEIVTPSIVRIRGTNSLNGSNAADVITTIENIPVTIRKNFNETAFFFPNLYADTAGNYSFSFTMPDALTKWKWMSLAHTKDLAFGTNSTSIITQKALMVQANAPRFIREGDKLEFSGKVVNLSDKELSGQVTLELVDAATGSSVDGWFQNVFPVQYFTAAAGQSTAIKFPIQVPFSFNKTLSWRLIARADKYSDGEENMLPVLTNRQLVTESLPILITKDTTQSFRFGKLLQASSPSLTHEGISINYTANPIWEAIRALPYLMEYPYECVEQTFNRFYANTLGTYIVNRDPKIKKVFETWLKDTATPKSKLALNESLKQIMLEETPWVFAAQSQEEQLKNIALLFDLFRLNQQADQLVKKLQDMQLSDGSFSWFKGGYSDRYMTNYVLTGIGKLKRTGALTPDIAIQLKPVIEKAIHFLDEEINKEYQYWKKTKLDTSRNRISTSHIQYLYMRSFFRDIALPKYAEAYQFFYTRGKYQIQQQSLYNRALLGLVYYRNNELRYVNVNIRTAILENTVRDEAKASLYWKDRLTYSWYQTPVEHQATMIQFLQELQQGQPMSDGNTAIDEARNWLLLNKQTNHWNTTVATAEACYALLMTGTDLFYNDKNIRIQLGNTSFSNQDQATEAGTGYFQQRIEGRLVNPEMGNIKITVQTKGNQQIQSPSWGSIYWQYFEDMDKIKLSATPLSVTKQLFIERNSNNGKVLDPVNENDVLKPGDKVVVRLTIKSDREMEYLHLKDTRASTMEPVNVLSGYKWQDGLGYYESTKDASTNFFISALRKGTYVFDYPVFITHTGVFSTGNASIQCMYAPEFTANSGAMMIRVEE